MEENNCRKQLYLEEGFLQKKIKKKFLVILEN